MSREKYESARVGISLFILFGILTALAVIAVQDSGSVDDYQTGKPSQVKAADAKPVAPTPSVPTIRPAGKPSP